MTSDVYDTGEPEVGEPPGEDDPEGVAGEDVIVVIPEAEEVFVEDSLELVERVTPSEVVVDAEESFSGNVRTCQVTSTGSPY